MKINEDNKTMENRLIGVSLANHKKKNSSLSCYVKVW